MNLLKSSVKYLLSVIGAAFFGLLILLIVTNPLRMLFDGAAESVLGCICNVLASMGLLFYLTYRSGYDENTPTSRLLPRQSVVQMVCAVALYIGLTVLLRYGTAGAATNVVLLAEVMTGQKIGIERMAGEYSGAMFASLLIQTLPFLPAMLAGYVCGARKRQKSRAELHKNT